MRQVDAATKESVWSIGNGMFYRGGVTDPDYCVLRFTASKGRHYCNLKKDDVKF
jgi:general stress protein 26